LGFVFCKPLTDCLWSVYTGTVSYKQRCIIPLGAVVACMQLLHAQLLTRQTAPTWDMLAAMLAIVFWCWLAVLGQAPKGAAFSVLPPAPAYLQSRCRLAECRSSAGVLTRLHSASACSDSHHTLRHSELDPGLMCPSMHGGSGVRASNGHSAAPSQRAHAGGRLSRSCA
jgi:hypothetical protein